MKKSRSQIKKTETTQADEKNPKDLLRGAKNYLETNPVEQRPSL
jgi:hypothetical protein